MTTASLFEPSKSIFRLGPTVFPKPTHLYNYAHYHSDSDGQRRTLDNEVKPLVRPLFGTHRPNVPAVFAYAEGYVLGHYMLFLQTLLDTGFDGDVVLAIADEPHQDVMDYLKEQSHVVVYTAHLSCFANDRTTHAPRTIKQRSMDVFQMCQLKNVYGYETTNTDNTNTDTRTTFVSDVRAGRVVATLRYEWYWIWSLHYQANQWILLLDARDSIFQSNPFDSTVNDAMRNNDKEQGILYFFGENANATRLGISKKNSKWLRNAYGNHVLNALKDKPTICSGSTMGNQRAIETYLRAMVNEWDETDISMTGADQGFHNFLYYSGKLQNAHHIDKLVVWEQGKTGSVVNSLGALRTKPLSEWANIYNNKTHQVFDWDGTTLSPVVHQWDRDQHLFRYTNDVRMKQMVRQWKKQQEKEKRQGR